MTAAQKVTESARRQNAYMPKPAIVAATSWHHARMRGEGVLAASSRSGENLGQAIGAPVYSKGNHAGKRPARSSPAANRRRISCWYTRSLKSTFTGTTLPAWKEAGRYAAGSA